MQSTTIQNLSSLSQHINQNDLQNFIDLLNLAMTGCTTQSQKKVYQMLKQIQAKPQSYYYFLFILLNNNYPQNLRYIAGTTMKSALQRNNKQIHFQVYQRDIMKNALISADNIKINHQNNISSSSINNKLRSIKNIIISQFATCFQEVDWQMIYFFINKIVQYPENITLLCTIFQDLKHNSQNYCYFQGSLQTQILQKLVTNLYNLFKQLLFKINIPQVDQLKSWFKYFTEGLKLMKIITFHLPLKLCSYFYNYVNEIIIPLLKLFSFSLKKQNLHQLNLKNQNLLTIQNFFNQTLQSINQISSTKSTYLLENKQFLDQFIIEIPINQQQFRKLFNQGIKIWTNTILQLFFNDHPNEQNEQNQDYKESKMSNYLQILIPQILLGFRFTKQDQSNILHQMQLQHNPYENQQKLNHNQQINDSDQQKQFNIKHGKAHGSTLRKVSITCIQKISQVYKDNFWSNNKIFIQQLLQNTNDYKVQQTAILFVGIIAQNCQEQLKIDINQLFQILITMINNKNHQILTASTLWAFQQLLPCYTENTQMRKYAYQIIYKVIGNKQEFQHLKNSKNLMVKQAAISLLDSLFSSQIDIQLQILNTMLQCLFYVLESFTGRALFNLFKALQSVFQQQQRQNNVQTLLVNQTVKNLCAKWTVSINKDSIMCPLVECLGLICENRKKYFLQFAPEILKQIYPLFNQKQRKSFVLRVIDLTTSIISAAKQYPTYSHSQQVIKMVSSSQFLQTLMNLLISEQRQIRHFGYGLLSDIAKLKQISNEKAEQFIQLIAKTMDHSNYTSTNNALMCLTDILELHSQIRIKYSKQILNVVVQFINKFPSLNLSKIYVLNFSRMFGRIANFDTNTAQYLFGLYPHLLKLVSDGLRSQQKSQLTLNAYLGLLKILNNISNEDIYKLISSKQIQHFIDSFMGYKYNTQNQQNMNQILISFNKIKNIVQNYNVSWDKYLNSTLLYPATINRILQLIN